MDEQVTNRNAVQFVKSLIELPNHVFLNVARNCTANDLIALEKTFKQLTDRVDMAFRHTKHFYANIRKEEEKEEEEDIHEIVAALLRCGLNLRTFTFNDLKSNKPLRVSYLEMNVENGLSFKLAKQCPNIEEFV